METRWRRRPVKIDRYNFNCVIIQKHRIFKMYDTEKNVKFIILM